MFCFSLLRVMVLVTLLLDTRSKFIVTVRSISIHVFVDEMNDKKSSTYSFKPEDSYCHPLSLKCVRLSRDIHGSYMYFWVQ